MEPTCQNRTALAKKKSKGGAILARGSCVALGAIVEREPALAMVIGAIISLVGVFPITALVALIIGIPTPIVGGVHRGLDAAVYSPVVVWTVGAFGGFLVVCAVGVLGSWAALKLSGGNTHRSRVLNVAIPLCLTTVVVVGVSVWARLVEQ